MGASLRWRALKIWSIPLWKLRGTRDLDKQNVKKSSLGNETTSVLLKGTRHIQIAGTSLAS